MGRSLDIQTLGTVTVLAAFVGAELAAWYLVACPSSEIAWYLNLGPFHIFETARNSVTAIHYLFSPLSLPVALLVLLAVLVAHHRGMRLLVAIGANLSFAFVIAMIFAEIQARSIMGNITPASVLMWHDFAMWLIVPLSISALSCLVSHASFFLAIRSEATLRLRMRSVILPEATMPSALTAAA